MKTKFFLTAVVVSSVAVLAYAPARQYLKKQVRTFVSDYRQQEKFLLDSLAPTEQQVQYAKQMTANRNNRPKHAADSDLSDFDSIFA